MKIVALLCGLFASAFGWAAGLLLVDVGAQFAGLWPDSVSQQFLGLAVFHTIVAGAVVGGILAVFSPISGAVLLLAVAVGWAWLATVLPIGFSLQMVVPLGLCIAGALAAMGALLRGRFRRQAEQRRPTIEELEREAALRLDPVEPLDPLGRPLPAFDLGESLRAASPAPAYAAAAAPAPHREDGPPRGLSGLLAANVAVLILLTFAVALLIYSELRSGDLGAAFAPSGPRAAHVSEGRPRIAEERTAPASRQDEAADVTEVAPEPETTTGSTVRQAALEGEWSDPFSYCQAVGTIDFPDRRYAGPIVATAVAEALRVPASSSPDRVKWRCYEGEVLGCASFDRPVCALTPSVPEMVEFCSKNPNARGLQAPGGDWACNGNRPEIPANQNWPVDARGFLPGAWIKVAAAPGG